jgi:hypothetical protein
MPWDTEMIIFHMANTFYFLWNPNFIVILRNLAMGLSILKLYLFLIYERLSQVMYSLECYQRKCCVLSLCTPVDLHIHRVIPGETSHFLKLSLYFNPKIVKTAEN